MTLTARTGMIALLGVLLVFVAPLGGLSLLLIEGALLVGVGLDVLLAGRVRDLRLNRAGATTTRLGETAVVTLSVVNAGSRRLRGQLRDGWPPSAGASPAVQRLGVPPGERR